MRIRGDGYGEKLKKITTVKIRENNTLKPYDREI